jgi:hypothetical protein
LAQHGLENPYVKFHGRLAPIMRARSKLTESGDVSFYNQSTSEGDRENDTVTKALQTKEQ